MEKAAVNISCERAALAVSDYGGHARGSFASEKMPDRIWNEVLAGLVLLDASFPTTSPSGDKVLRSVHQVHLTSSHEMQQRGESSLKSPCLLRAVLGPLLTCGCTCANLHWVNWLIQDRVEAEHDSFILLTYSGGIICISPYPASVHVIPVWQGRACKAELPPPSAQLWEGRLLPCSKKCFGICVAPPGTAVARINKKVLFPLP